MLYLLIAVALLAIGVLIYVGYRFVETRANLKFEQWKAAHSQTISRGAIKGSQAAVAGRVFERIAPYLPGFGYNARDVRFIGDPVDFVVFDGLSEGTVRNVVFIEVKTGNGQLNGNERKVKAAVVARRVEWSLFRVPDVPPGSDSNESPSDPGALSGLPNNALRTPQTITLAPIVLRRRGRE